MIIFMKIFGLLAICGTIVAVAGMWFSDRDAQVRAAASAYEACVKAEYGMTPIQWYEQNNKYPACGN